ncbi:MAG: T9SS type A sorting domain-containing protein, partial [Planctomycetota bacterium]
FHGITQTQFIPPDPIVAAGPQHLMALVNSDFAIFSKTGTNQKQISAETWFNNVAPGNNAFDPKVIYDHFAKRWVMVWLAVNFSDSTSYLLVSASDDSIPDGTWCNWALPGHVNGTTPDTTWSDYQGLGFDDQAVYIVPNQFGFNFSFSYAKIRIIPKSTLYDAGCPAITYTDLWDLQDPDNPGLPVATTRPAVTYGTPGVEYLISDSRFLTGNTVTLWSLTNPLSATPTLTGVNVPVTQRTIAPDAEQLGGGRLLDVGGSRVRNVVYRDGSVWTAHSVGDASGLYARARYLRIAVAGPTVLEDVSWGSDNCWLFFPAITADALSNMVLVYNQSCTDEYASIRYTGRRPTDPGLQPSAQLKAGETNYQRGPGDDVRWGDYNGVAVDPVDTTLVWMFAEYAASPANTWGTWFGQVFPGKTGDINDDGVVDVADVVLLVSFILEQVTPNPFEFAAADCNVDSSLDVGDVVCLVNLILGGTAAPMLASDASRAAPRAVARLSRVDDAGPSASRTVLLETELGPGIAALEARITYNAATVNVGRPQVTERARGFELAVSDKGDELHILLYNLGGGAIEPGDGPLLRIPVEILGDESAEDDIGLRLVQVKVADWTGTVHAANLDRASLTALPARFRLSEPYPNPVGQTGTSLELEIPETVTPSLSGEGPQSPVGPLRVVVEVFNVRGQKVRTVMDTDLMPGRHAIEWDGRSDRGDYVGSGLYVLRLRAGAFTETRKLIVQGGE